MPVVKLAATKDGRRLANYLQRDDAGNDRAVFVSEYERGKIERVNSAQHSEKEFQEVREHFAKTEGVQAHMAYISFKKDDLGDLARPDGKPDWEKIEAFTHEYAKRAGIADRYQYYAVAHDDKANPHVHLVWNAVSDKDGMKYHQSQDVDRQRDIADRLSLEHGIRNLPEREKNAEKVHDKVIQAVDKRGAPEYSWKRDLQYRVRDAATRATSWENFKERLERNGVETRERGKGVSYSFKDDGDAKRVARGSRLGEAYTREDIERRFEFHRKIHSTPGREAMQKGVDNLKYEQKHFASWKQELRAAFREAERKAHSPEEFRQLAQERGLAVERNPEGRYELRYQDRFGVDHKAGADVLRKGTSDQALEARIERTSDNPATHEQASLSPTRVASTVSRGAQSLSQVITQEIEKNSNPQGGIPERGFDRTRDRERKRVSDGDERRARETPGGEKW